MAAIWWTVGSADHNIKEYLVLRTLLATGTATAAGQRLGMSQSGVSRCIAQLEARLGHMLFVRQQGRMTPTPEAQALNASLAPLFETLERIETGRWSDAGNAVLRLAAPPTLAHRFMPDQIASFLKLHPERRIMFEICSSDVLFSGIAEDRFDIAIASLGAPRTSVHYDPFCRSRAVCVMPAGHPLAKLDVVRPEHLAETAFVALTRRHRTRAFIDRICSEAGFVPHIVVETATAVALVELVRRGMGVSLTNPFPVAQSLGKGLEMRPFEPALEYQTCFITASATPISATGRAFMRHVRMRLSRLDHVEPC
ncbi:MAG: LysR family transcriptional regulator [Hyphomicrobiaceae bacterium]|nr:LysR family transcriptional regulator [Hyphomicrobiaceae bacterium]